MMRVFNCLFADMTSLMAELSPSQKKDECIAFSLNLRAAWAMSNYCRFFKLYLAAPKMAGYLIDWFAERERKSAMKILVKGYVILLLRCALFMRVGEELLVPRNLLAVLCC